MSQADHFFLFALGGNMPSGFGTCAQTLRAAVARLEGVLGRSLALSPLYRTPSFPAGAGPDYVNAAALVRAPQTPSEMLDLLHMIEAEFGRERVQRWGRRTLDLDLIAVDQMILPDPETQRQWRDLPLSEQVVRVPEQLILPHPRLQERAFVLVPLADVAPEWVHPVLGRSVAQMLADLPVSARNEVVPL